VRAANARLNIVLRFATVLVALLLLSLPVAHAAELVTGEATRLRVLRLVFPNATISSSPARLREKSSPASHLEPLAESLTDALEQEQEYDVVGPVAKDEEPAAENDPTRSPGKQFADRRRVRFLLYRWHSKNNDQPSLLAVINYLFPDASPARCCRAVGKVMLLSDSGDRIIAVLDRMPNAFTTFAAVKFVDAGSSGTEELVLGMDFAGAGTVGVNTAIFDLSGQRISPLGWLTSAVYYGLETKGEELYTMTLDERQTRLSKDRRIWFTKKTYIYKGKRLATPSRSMTSIHLGNKAVALNWC
jgi:hypothetical protein